MAVPEDGSVDLALAGLTVPNVRRHWQPCQILLIERPIWLYMQPLQERRELPRVLRGVPSAAFQNLMQRGRSVERLDLAFWRGGIVQRGLHRVCSLGQCRGVEFDGRHRLRYRAIEGPARLHLQIPSADLHNVISKRQACSIALRQFVPQMGYRELPHEPNGRGQRVAQTLY